ncbi:5-carboxymethyl-2-hydroxymuconate Delta-isomerase [Vreelandella alkaliphila]|uniref:5-carboxymethyl-2-hydroxymuconate Delta-isomerase n=1 Tax=Vreelandella alkaliphila TaxID=272774 RepID=UPI003FD72521
MPHSIVEHSASLDGELILPLVFSGAMTSALFEADGSDIKVRSIAYQSYLTGQATSEFVHVVLKILSGRTPAQKQMLSRSVLAQLQTLELPRCSLTVEVVDIERASYSKWVSESWQGKVCAACGHCNAHKFAYLKWVLTRIRELYEHQEISRC